ncbi:hypothetical protein EPN96_01790 [bacterium]|nr:MAG: hypothetical protein EPN96_01790 [bacterium]
MGMEHFEYKRITCLCGKGSFVARHYSPDYPFGGGSYQYRYSIECEECINKYEIVEQGKVAVPVLLSDLNLQKELFKRWHQMSAEFMKHEIVAQYIEKFTSLLAKQPSIAAAHRLASIVDSGVGSYSSFCRSWSGAAPWVQRNIRPNNLPSIINVLEAEDKKVTSMLSEIDSVLKKAQTDLKSQGVPLVDNVP